MPENSIDSFIAHTGRSTVAVVVPLYGYWNDVPNNPLLEEPVLSFSLNRLYSNVHNLFIIFVANPETIENNPKNPTSVANVLLSKARAGNTKNLPIDRDATYPEYIAKGIDYALTETKAQFVMVFNPWVMVQEGGVDVLVDRANRADEAKAISGYDLRSEISPEQFEGYRNPMLNEKWFISFDFFCMPRFAAEMVKWDTSYKTHTLFEFDVAQQLRSFGFAAINYPQATIFPFEFPWKTYEKSIQQQEDQSTFTKKWGFSVQLEG